jgi:hypothetical protein
MKIDVIGATIRLDPPSGKWEVDFHMTQLPDDAVLDPVPPRHRQGRGGSTLKLRFLGNGEPDGHAAPPWLADDADVLEGVVAELRKRAREEKGAFSDLFAALKGTPRVHWMNVLEIRIEFRLLFEFKTKMEVVLVTAMAAPGGHRE